MPKKGGAGTSLRTMIWSAFIFLSQMTLLRWLTFLLRSQTVSWITVLLFWISFFLLMIVFVPQWPSHSQQDALFHFIAYDYSCADWASLCDHLRDVSLEDIFKLSASAAAAHEFSEWVQVVIDVYISHQKYQVRSHSSPWFSAACAAYKSRINRHLLSVDSS